MKRMALIVGGLLAACSSGPTTSKYDQTQVPVTPTGVIVGRLLDMTNYAPLEGATVVVLGAAEPTTLTSNADGLFTFNKAVVSSSYSFVITKEGYLRAVTSSSISGSTGNSPLAGGIATFTLQMFKADGEVQGVVFLPNGAPAGNATVVVDQRASLGTAYESLITGVTAADGSYSLRGLATRPSGQSHTVYALWFDENRDGKADYGTTSTGVTVFPGAVARAWITYSTGIQRIVSSNIIDGEVGPTDDLQFVFAIPLMDSNLNGQAQTAYVLTNTTVAPNRVVPVEASWTDSTHLALKVVGGLKEGDRYSLQLTLTNENAGTQGVGATFAPAALTFQVRGSTTAPITAQISNLQVTNPTPTATQSATQFEWNSNSFLLSWDAAANAIEYRIYAKDTSRNPNFAYVTNLVQRSARLSTTVVLPAAFDPNPVGGAIEPLSMGNQVTFTVIGMDVYGNYAPLTAAPTATVKDNLPPSINPSSGIAQTIPAGGKVDAINDDSQPYIVQFKLTYSEPMDPTSSPEFITQTATGVTKTFQWDGVTNGSVAGYLTLSIAPGVDATGPFTIRGGSDMAGNALANYDIVGSLGGRKELLTYTSTGFESAGGCSLNGWVTSGDGGMPLPVAVSNSARTGRCAALLGSLPGTLPAAGLSRITQDIAALPSFDAGLPWTYEAKAAIRPVHFDPYGTSTSVSQNCKVLNGEAPYAPIVTVGSGFASSNQASYQGGVTGTSFSVAGVSKLRLQCEVNNPTWEAPAPTPLLTNTAMYVDDVSVSLVKPGVY